MKLSQLRERARGKSPRTRDVKNDLAAALEAAARGEMDVLVHDSENIPALVRDIDRLLTRDHPPLCVLNGFEVEAHPQMLWIGFAPLINPENIGLAVKSVQTMIGVLGKLGEPEPKVALLSCVEMISPGVPSTVWEAVLGQMGRRGQFGKAKVDGPLAYDLAVSEHAVLEKGLKSEVGGHADLLVPPDLNSFCTLVDSIHLSGKHDAVMLIVGGPVPVVLGGGGLRSHRDVSVEVAALLI